MATRGRPKRQVDQKLFESMCAIQATEEEMCLVLEMTDKTLNRWCKDTYGKSFKEIYKEKRAVGKISLRRYQFNLAKKNTAMAIFLGKNYLGQKDNPNESNEVSKVDLLIKSVPNNLEKGIE